MAYINGIWYDDYGQTQQYGTPTGIGGAPSGYSPIRDQLRAAEAAQAPNQYTPMPPDLLALTRGLRLNSFTAPQGMEQQYAAQDALGAQRINQNVANYYQANPLEAQGQLGAIGGVQNDPRYYDTSGTPGSPYPNNPYLVSNKTAQGFTSEGNQFTRGALGPNGAIQWTRSDGANLNPMNQQEFAKFFGNDLASYYYGTGSQGNGSPYPMNPYQTSNLGNTSFTSEGQQFNLVGRGTDGSLNWQRSDGTNFNNLSQSEFAKYFGNDVAGKYYGANQNNPYPTSAYQTSGLGANGFTSEGQQFQIAGRNPDGTMNWRSSDGTMFNNLSGTEFAKYFGQNVADQYYGGGGSGGGFIPNMKNENPYAPPPSAPGSATAQNPFLNLGLNAFTNTQQGFDTSYLDNLSNNLYKQAGKAYAENFAPAMDSAAITAGGYGGDRAALAKGYVQNNLMQNVANSMAPQYVGAYENSMNRALQGGQAAASTGTALENLDVNKLLGLGNLGVSSYNADTSRQLGMGNLNLGQYQADTQRQLGVGALNTNQYQADTQRQLGMGDLANKNYLAQGQVANWANQAANPQYTNPWGAAIGGGLLGYQLLNSILGNQTTPN